MSSELVFHCLDQIGWIKLNRPDCRNAISKNMWDALPGAMQKLQEDGARLLIFEGEGGNFASGADLSELEKLDSLEASKQHWLSIRSALNAVADFPLPTIAMIRGACIG